ncbi:hypothetical protein PCA20602_00280 [Pandoraea capi]|uniref:MFS transporter n=1 Tax=Pandoraea capi TaxID=2508286 RepID=A0ABY6VMC6_9BURK|nr:hypothetical protein PCA20602_00280 [Pandoraea capi]
MEQGIKRTQRDYSLAFKLSVVAQSMLVTAWNVAIAGGGIIGGVLLDRLGVAATAARLPQRAFDDSTAQSERRQIATHGSSGATCDVRGGFPRQKSTTAAHSSVTPARRSSNVANACS